MNIRSITAFTDATYPFDTSAFASIGEALKSTREALEASGYTVQTTRLALQSFPTLLEEAGPGKAVDLAKDLEALGFVHEIDYVALGPVRLTDAPSYVETVYDILKQTENVFCGIEVANRETGISLPRIRRTADVIKRIATLNDDGFKNLFMTVLANVAPWSPFLPAAYHGGGASRIAIATESADLAVKAVESASSLQNAREVLVKSIEVQAERIDVALERALSQSPDIGYQGIDFSLAPYPDEARSIGAALEKLGLASFGQQGSLMAAAFLTDAIDRAQFKHTGFCGLMLPVLEDTTLAERAAQETLSINELLTYSAVCGTGLDLIPLPGDVSSDTLAPIIMDMAALALRLDKPLTARLMPLPGKQAGDIVSFDFEYFADSKVMTPSAEVLGGLLIGDEAVTLRARAANRVD